MTDNDDVKREIADGNQGEEQRKRGRPKMNRPRRMSVTVLVDRGALRLVQQDAKAKGYSLGESLDWFVRSYQMSGSSGAPHGDAR
jgi:hypothetical protein